MSRFLLRRWTEPTTRAGESYTEKQSRYVREQKKEGRGGEEREEDEVRVLAEMVACAKFGKL